MRYKDMKMKFQNTQKIKHTIITAIDAIAVLGFAVTAIMEAKYKNIPVWVSLGFSVIAIITSSYEMFTAPKIEEDIDEV